MTGRRRRWEQERNPGQDDDEQRGDVHLDQVVAHLTLQVETSLDTGEFTWRGMEIGQKIRDDFSIKRERIQWKTRDGN